MLKLAFSSLLLVLTAACTQLPRAELRAYSEAVIAARTAAEPIIADYAVAERGELLHDMQADRSRYTGDYFQNFRVEDRAALSTITLPPGAGAVDRAFRAIANYTETLVALAENRNIDEARGQLGQVLDNLGGIGIPQVGQATAVIKPIADLLVTALSPAIQADNREQFRRIVLDGAPRVHELIGVLRAHTPTQYSSTTVVLRRAAAADPRPTNHAELVARINAWHRAYADYVALLDAIDQRLAELRAAIAQPRSVPLLQRAVAGSADLRAHADALRLSLARLRAQP